MKKFNPKKKLPETIYGYWHNDSKDGDDDNTFLHTSPEPEPLVESNETRRVGVYKLVGYAEIKNTTVTTNETNVHEIK